MWYGGCAPFLALAFALDLSGTLAGNAANSSLCAEVKIQISQQLTLERQAFQATMTINNGVAGVPLTGIDVNVNFTDPNGNLVRATSDPNDLTASFYMRLQNGSSIPASIPGSSSSSITWLIIPSLGAAGSSPQGQLYSVGASLSYISGGQSNLVQVSPATISVLPLPDLMLDYFLPSEVYGDDPFTDFVESPVPFSLGVRAKNTGYGAANGLQIQSAQPQIVENKLGLLVSFQILGSEVNGLPATASLLANFGDIQPNRSGVARWIMTSSLSGRFVSFTANFTHADDLGGQLTSLISNITTHVLVHDVLVDLPGRDSVRDFLALDGSILRVYESQNADTTVADQSGLASISGSNLRYTVTTTPSSGFIFIKLSDPLAGAQTLRSATRVDGKALNPANAWLSQTQDRNTHKWSYYVNVFDANNTAGLSYTLQFGPLTDQANRPPVLDPIPDHSVPVGAYLGFAITASDPDANTIKFSLEGVVPSGATLDPDTGAFAWHPTANQTGTNWLTVKVTDNGQPPLSATAPFAVIVNGLIPAITNQPTNVVQTAGGTASFSVGVDGTAPFAYQWQLSSTNLPNATNATLTLTNLLIESSGAYAVYVTNAFGSTLSSNAQLTVNLVRVALGTTKDKSVNASVTKLLSINKLHASYPLTLTSVAPNGNNGGSVTVIGDVLKYVPPSSYVGADTFTYSVTNGHGGSAEGSVIVSITPEGGSSVNIVSFTANATSRKVLCFGIPGRKYILQAANEINGTWADLSDPIIADATGLIEFIDTISPYPSIRFYRIRAAVTP